MLQVLKDGIPLNNSSYHTGALRLGSCRWNTVLDWLSYEHHFYWAHIGSVVPVKSYFTCFMQLIGGVRSEIRGGISELPQLRLSTGLFAHYVHENFPLTILEISTRTR